MIDDPRIGPLPEKVLPLARQLGTNDSRENLDAAGNDPVIVENYRRLKRRLAGLAAKPAILAKPEPKPDFPVSPVIPATPDRRHKSGGTMIIVANKHWERGVDTDPVPDPGKFATIAEAYAFAKELVALASSVYYRVTIIVEGGYYEENLTLDGEQIDIVGDGMPLVYGAHTITNGCTQTHIQNIYFSSVSEPPQTTITIDPHSGGSVDPGGILPPLRFSNCIFESSSRAFLAKRRFRCDNGCIFIGDGPDGDGPVRVEFNIGFGLINQEAGWAHIINSEIYGVFDNDLRPAGFALEITCNDGIAPNNNGQTLHTGVYLSDTRLYGASLNEGWRLVANNCPMYAGFYVPTLASKCVLVLRCYTNTPPQPDIDSLTQVDNSLLSAGAAVISTDRNVALGTATNNLWMRDDFVLLPTGDASAGQTFNVVALPSNGTLIVDIVEVTAHNAAFAGGAGITLTQTASTAAVPAGSMFELYIP